MAFCGKCGTKLEEGVRFCPSCGADMTVQPETEPQHNPGQNQQTGFGAKAAALNNTADTTAEFDAKDITDNKAMGILAYIGPLCFIPMFAAKGSRFARFHANQGLVLLIACVAWNIATGILNMIIRAISWRLGFITWLISLLSVIFLVLAVLGIINAANGRAKELPVIGKIKILK